jgi:hypothetical protein
MKNKYLYDADTKSVLVDIAWTKHIIEGTEHEIRITPISDTYFLELIHERKEYHERVLLALIEQARNIEAGLDKCVEVT